VGNRDVDINVNSAILAVAKVSVRDERHTDERQHRTFPIEAPTTRRSISDMPEKYLRRGGLPLLLRHTGLTTLPEEPPTSTAGVSGTTVFCLHDAGLQSSIFKDLMSCLPDNYVGLGFDLPGHGRSGSLDALSSIEEMAEMAQWVSQWCRTERPIVVGHGMGALVAIEWARAHNDSVGGLLLCGIGRTLGIDDATIETMRRVTRGKAPRPFDPSRVAKGAGPDVLKRAYTEGIQTDPRATLVDFEASRRFFDAINGSDFEFACPVRFMDGAAESDTNRDRSRSFAEKVAGSSCGSIDDAAHYLPFEQPKSLVEEIQRIAEAT
jgi:pimeloyl-ACP methyl ester carboxylesterase